VFTCTIFKYLNADIHKLFISICMFFLIPLTLMSRKHYTVDVWTALYVGPIVFELLYLKWKDPETRGELAKRYGIKYSGDLAGDCYVTINKVSSTTSEKRSE